MSQVVSQFTLLLNSRLFFFTCQEFGSLLSLSDSTQYLTAFDRAALAVSRREQVNIKRGFLPSGILRCVSG